MGITTITGIAASVFTSLTLLPQLVKIIREKNAEGTSMVMLLVLFVGLVLWVVYGVLKDDWIIIVANGFSLVVNVTTAALGWKYK